MLMADDTHMLALLNEVMEATPFNGAGSGMLTVADARAPR